MQPIRVAIIGAGPAGLTLARVLQHKSKDNEFDVKIYEKDTSQNTRQQGGTLDLHPKAGQLAVEQAGLMDKFWAKARPEGQDLRLLDKNDQAHLEWVAEEGEAERPEIDRTILRDIFLESLQPNTIQWGHKFLSVSPSSDGISYTLNFDNGKVVEADIVVGAEGAWSKVRNFLTDVKPVYAGVSMVEICLSDIDKKNPDLGKYVGRGSVFVFSDGKGIQAQRNSTGSVRVYVGMSVPEKWISESKINFENAGEVRAKLLEFFADWKSKSLDFIRKCDDNHFLPRALYALPIVPKEEEEREKEGKWPKHHERVTLIGDSAHLTGPSGTGVNYAMLDGLLLAQGLLDAKTDDAAKTRENLDAAVRDFQKGLFVRCRDAGARAEKIMKFKYAADAPVTLAAVYKKAHEEDKTKSEKK